MQKILRCLLTQQDRGLLTSPQWSQLTYWTRLNNSICSRNLKLPTRRGQTPSREKVYGQLRQRLISNLQATIGYNDKRHVWTSKGEASDLRTLQRQAWLWWHHALRLFYCQWYCYIRQNEWNSNLTSNQLGHNWLFQQDNDPKDTSEMVLGWIKHAYINPLK